MCVSEAWFRLRDSIWWFTQHSLNDKVVVIYFLVCIPRRTYYCCFANSESKLFICTACPRTVQSALPAIDVGPPLTHNHVSVKLKKLQQEGERTAKIEEQNLKLLQQLGTIMCKNRLDNHWIVSPPNFLQRVAIYKPCKQNIHISAPFPNVIPEKPISRKQRCLACSPQNIQQIKIIPEERVPWELPRPSIRRPKNMSINITTGRMSSPSENHTDKQAESSAHQITLTSGNLQLAVKFPAHSSVKLQNGGRDKLLRSEYCECNAFITTK